MEKETKEFLLRKFQEKWAKDNKGMIDDCWELVDEVMMFRMKWGIPFELVLSKEDMKE